MESFDPYITNTNGNKRLDLMSLFSTLLKFYPEIKIPEDEDRKYKSEINRFS